MELINKGILFVFKDEKEYNSDLIVFFRKKHIYCEPIRENQYYEYIKMFKPKYVFSDLNISIDGVENFDLNSIDTKEKIFNNVEKSGIEHFWTKEFYIEYIKDQVLKEFKDKKIPILSLSTGIDSTLLAVLLENTLKRKIKCLYVNVGLNRKRDIDDLKYLQKKYKNLDIEMIDISKDIYKNLKGIENQLEKKNIIRKIFIENLNKSIKKYTNDNYRLVEGSIVTDTFKAFIGNRNSLSLIKCLTKEEVKEYSKHLGISEGLINKPKFPLIGFAKKIVGEVTKENVEKLANVDDLFCKEMLKIDGVSENAHYIDVSYMKNDDVDIYIYRVDSRIIDNKIVSYETICNIIKNIQKNYEYYDKSLLDVSNNTDALLMQR